MKRKTLLAIAAIAAVTAVVIRRRRSTGVTVEIDPESDESEATEAVHA